jgi:regulator of Ty1 transposition protein 109
MAAYEHLGSQAPIVHLTLTEKLAKVLPRGSAFRLYHVSTPPNKTQALYSAPPGGRPDRTYCESHYLSASINVKGQAEGGEKEVLIFAIEILVYSTAYSTTIFVSKADSTGYLHLLGLPKGSTSPLKEISSTFLEYIVERRKRPGIRTIVSLFARAQDQYLFPGSIENSGKHVLDDRGLVKWWCRVLDSLVGSAKKDSKQTEDDMWDSIRGHLVVPGLDKYESMSFLPKIRTSWIIGHPLQEISRFSTDAPPRSLIPHFPDDPKARYLDELDDEITESQENGGGQWKSVKSLDQFWEMMAFRQECSAGRLVGFIWVVFTPPCEELPLAFGAGDSQDSMISMSTDINEEFLAQISPKTSFATSSQPLDSSPLTPSQDDFPRSQQSSKSSRSTAFKTKKNKLSGPIIARQPKIKTSNRPYAFQRPENTMHYTWPADSRGQLVVDEKDYKRLTELLLRLDFADLDLASSSSQRWINELRSGAPAPTILGSTVNGTKAMEIKSETAKDGTTTTLSMGLVRKKRKVETVTYGHGADSGPASSCPAVATQVQTSDMPKVNVLSVGMIRKKSKT